MKLRAIRSLFAIPVIVSASDSKTIIKELLQQVSPKSVAESHTPQSFFAICQQLGLGDISVDDCHDVNTREELVSHIFSLLHSFFYNVTYK